MPSRSQKLRAVRAFDTHAGLRDALSQIGQERGSWAGIPMPLTGERLIIEPSYPKAKELMEIGVAERAPSDLDDARIRNSWYSLHHRAVIILWEQNGRIDWGKRPAFHHIQHDLRTLGCSDAWGIEQEANALQLLGTMLRHRQFKQYLLTGMFLEKSARSGVTYLFRKLRPTLAIKANAGLPEKAHGMEILCGLCMHPIAYYDGSWAGAMCPTDDVIAHLAMMRGDEAMLWRRCNQHPPYRPEAGL
jgi:hypothetical protein